MSVCDVIMGILFPINDTIMLDLCAGHTILNVLFFPPVGVHVEAKDVDAEAPASTSIFPDHDSQRSGVAPSIRGRTRHLLLQP
jgi:hypothetical protein